MYVYNSTCMYVCMYVCRYVGKYIGGQADVDNVPLGYCRNDNHSNNATLEITVLLRTILID